MISSTDSRDSRRSVNFGEDKINILSIPIPAINGEERAKSAQGRAKSAMERAKSAPPGMRTLDRQPKQRLINKRYNSPVVTTLVLASFTILIVGNIFAFIVVVDNVYGSTSYYIKGFWFGSAGSIFVRAFLPIWYITFYHTDFRTFIFKTWRDLWLNVCLQKNRVQPTHTA